MSYSRRKFNIVFDYKLDGTTISHTTYVRDLGVTFDNQFDFSLHLNEISSKASKLLSTDLPVNFQTLKALAICINLRLFQC